MKIQDDTYLAHHGVKGQKWGIRKASTSSGTGRKKSKNALINITINKNTKEKKGKKSNNPLKDLSDQELQQKVNRIQLEKRYAELTSTQKSKSKGFVSDVLRDSSKKVAKKYTAALMDAGVKKVFDKAGIKLDFDEGKKKKKGD